MSVTLDEPTTQAATLPNPSAIDFGKAPFVAIWETTRACDLACRHCRAEAISRPLPGELSTEEGFAVLDELALMGTPICVLSGGDPAKRSDLCDLVRHGKNLGMRMATIPAATPLLTRRLVGNLKDAGLSQMALSLDGPTPEVHDNFRGTPGAFERTLEGSVYAAEVGLPLQINTVFSAYNAHYFDSMAQLVRLLDVVFWEVFFLVPMGRGKELGQMNAAQFEALFAKLADFAHSVKFIVKVTEAPHYRRYLMQQRRRMECGRNDPRGFTADVPYSISDVKGPEGVKKSEPWRLGIGPSDDRPLAYARGSESFSAFSRFYRGQLPAHMRRDFGPGGSIGLAPKGVNSGNGHLFISYCGDICPSGFLPLACGNIRTHSIADVYREHHVFCELRNPDLLRGKCGVCEFRNICGGSRARAYAMTGDYLAEEPFCAYLPKGLTCPEEYASFT